MPSPHDPQRVVDTRAWFQKAANDLRAAQHDLDAIPPLLGDVAFHCQQSAEKTLKGLLTWHDQPFRKTHDLVELGQQCVKVEPSLEPLCKRVDRLTVYAWIFRYPGDPEEPTREEAEEAIALAREVSDAICMHLPEEVQAH